MNNNPPISSNISFSLMLQQSINFIINQKKFLQYFVIALFLNSIISLAIPVSPIFSVFIESIISCWLLFSVNQVSLQQNVSMKFNLQMSLTRFFGFMICKILALLPLLITLSSLASNLLEFSADNTSFVLIQNPDISPVLYLVPIVGFLLSANLLISPVIYLLKNHGIINSLGISWHKNRKIQTKAIIYAIIYLFLSLVLPLGIYYLLGTMLSPTLNIIISGVISSLLSCFTIIFSYRFFSLAFNDL